MQTNFFHNEERLVMVGESDEKVREFGGRKEIFKISDQEQLIGCELESTGDVN